MKTSSTLSVYAGYEAHLNFDLSDYLKQHYPDALSNHVNVQTFKKGEYIYTPGENTHHMYEILYGAAKLGTYTDDGSQTVYDIISPGEFFGNLKYLNGEFFEFSKALVFSKIRCYSLEFFKKIINEDPVVADWFHFYLVKRWANTEKKLVKVNTHYLENKIQYLHDTYHKQIYDAKNRPHYLIDLLSMEDMGDLIGVTRQTIAKGLKRKV